MLNVHIIGCAGVPANYGGFETLADQLIQESHAEQTDVSWTVYSESSAPDIRWYLGARIKRLPFRANGLSSILYDACSLVLAAFYKADIVLILGVSGGLFIPIARFFFKYKVVLNPDGIEHRREKWGWFAQKFLLLSESIAIAAADEIIADNKEIKLYVAEKYGRKTQEIAYGGLRPSDSKDKFDRIRDQVRPGYALSICRIEPENNIEILIRPFLDDRAPLPLLIIGNWQGSDYSRAIFRRFENHDNITLLGPIYSPELIDAFRSCASLYLHGHSAGGTNPSLVEAMHYRLPILAWDCGFNRATMQGRGYYFSTSAQLSDCLDTYLTQRDEFNKEAAALEAIAIKNYSWKHIHERYISLLNSM